MEKAKEDKGLSFETQLLEGILRRIRTKTNIQIYNQKENIRVELIICVQMAMEHCIENLSWLAEQKGKQNEKG